MFNSSEESNYVLQIYDVTGRVVVSEEKKAVEGINSIDLDLTFLSKGSYFVRLISKDLSRFKRLIIE